MSKFPEALSAVLLISVAGLLPAEAGKFGLGRPALPEEIAAWDVNVRPDGEGFPPGSGTAEQGEELFADNCASCHGDFGEGVGRWPVLAGGQGTLADRDPVKTVGSYWPYLSTVWDYVHRSMPFGNAQTLSNDDAYAIVAYILYSNDLVDYDFELSKETFQEVRMPNAEGFFVDDRDSAELPKFTGEPCMQACKESVRITMHASVLDVTPATEGGDEAAVTDASATETAAAEATSEAAGEVPAVEEAAASVETAAEAGPDPALVDAGETVFRKCQACHKVGDGAKNAVGPVLNGVVGRHAGSVEGFRYSNPMKAAAEAGLVWDEANLTAFLADPKGFMRGTKMSFAGLSSEDDIRAVIAYLSTKN